MAVHSKTLKTYFFRVLIFSLFVPFVISISILWNFISNTNERIKLANNQLKRTYDLEITDSFHKVQSALNIVVQSEELKSYFNSTIDSEKRNKENLIKVIQLVMKNLKYQGTKWYVINSRGIVIISIPKEFSRNISVEMGTTIDLKNDSIKFMAPISYKLSFDSNNFRKNLGYICVLVPNSEIRIAFPELIKIEKISRDLDIKDFQTKINVTFQNANNIFLLYLYIFISFLFILFGTLWGLKIFQKNIVDRILSLRARVRNEMEYIDKNELKNELESLSQTFDLYLRYTLFLQKEILKSSQLAAAGNVAHYIAHDIRKPFSKLRFFINELKELNSIKEINYLLEEFEPSFHTSIEYIEHILNEVMDAAITKLNITEGVSLESILEKTFENLGPIPNNTNITIEYDLTNQLYLTIDQQRVIRIIVNIITNAIEAMKYKGNLWIKSKEFYLNDTLFMEICIGNSNSFISDENIENIFEPFFTFKKENGTGLGLSIAQKIVHLHGGKIKCESKLNKGVEFIFTLPATHENYNKLIYNLPKNINENKFKLIENYKNSKNISLKEHNILIVDDDPLICRAWQRLTKDVNVISFLKPEDCISFIYKNENNLLKIDMIISDYFFGKNSNLSFENFIKVLREQYRGKLFLSSDISINEDSLIKEFNIIIIAKKIYTLSELNEICSENEIT